MLEFVLFVLGVLIGQFALLLAVRVRLGYDGWQALNVFHDMWLNGEIEWNTDDDDEEDKTVTDSRNDGVKTGHGCIDPEEDDRK